MMCRALLAELICTLGSCHAGKVAYQPIFRIPLLFVDCTRTVRTVHGTNLSTPVHDSLVLV
jgi:hypothetical protein